MRNLDDLPLLRSVTELINCLREDPLDRVLMPANDLSPEEWCGATATRTDDHVMVVYSTKNLGANSIEELVQAVSALPTSGGSPIGEVAVIGTEGNRTRFGRAVPDDIKQLLEDAEEMTPGRLLSWVRGYEDIYVLADHPRAEK